jgi:hypothetical protein
MAQNISIRGNEVPAVLSGAVRKYRFLTISGNNTYIESNSEEITNGVSRDAGSASGDVVRMQVDGYAVVQAGGTITAADYVTPDADGKAVLEDTTNKPVAGQAITGAVDGDYFTVDLNARGYLSSS